MAFEDLVAYRTVNKDTGRLYRSKCDGHEGITNEGYSNIMRSEIFPPRCRLIQHHIKCIGASTFKLSLVLPLKVIDILPPISGLRFRLN